MLAVVTGAGIRVGRAIALAFAADGYDVVVHANKNTDKAKETAAEIEKLGRKAFVEQADLANDDAIDALAARIIAAHGAVDVLVHSAGAFEQTPFARIGRPMYRAMQAINVEAPFFLTQRLLDALLKGKDPCVINIVDIAAERPMNRGAHYSMSKAALSMMTKALAVELGPHVRVCGVAPGTVAFPEDFSAAARDAVVKRIPLLRSGTPDDVARACVFLAHAPYITGVILPVDGGRAAVL